MRRVITSDYVVAVPGNHPGGFLTAAQVASGVILVDSGDPTTNTSTPGDNSGWQYESQFGGWW